MLRGARSWFSERRRGGRRGGDGSLVAGGKSIAFGKTLSNLLKHSQL